MSFKVNGSSGYASQVAKSSTSVNKFDALLQSKQAVSSSRVSVSDAKSSTSLAKLVNGGTKTPKNAHELVHHALANGPFKNLPESHKQAIAKLVAQDPVLMGSIGKPV